MASNETHVQGLLQPATEEGFKLLIAKANEVYKQGLILISVVPVGNKLGGVFVRTPRGTAATLIGE